MRKKRLIWLIGGVGIFLLVCPGRAEEAKRITCTVRVVDAGARPVPGAEVAAYESFYDYGNGRIRTELLAKERTGVDGVCTLKLEVENRVNTCLVARKEGLAFAWDYVGQFGTHPKKMLLLEKPIALAGTVVDDNGNAIAGAKVRALPARYSVSGPRVPFDAEEPWLITQTDAAGRFSFNNFSGETSADFFVSAPGKAMIYTCFASDSSAGFHYTAGQKDIRIVLQPETIIKGRVVNPSGKGVLGVKLLARPDKSLANYYCVNWAVSEKDGQFTFKGVPADTYSLQIVAPREKMSEWVGEDVKVDAKTGETVEGIRVRVNKGAILTLAVKDAATNEPIDSVGVGVSQPANFGRHPCLYTTAHADKNGIARIRVPIGECSIRAGGSGYSFYRESCTVEGEKAYLEILLDRDPAVFGTVRDEAGRPLEDVTVAVVPTGRSVGRTDAQGKFRISYRLRSEEVYVLARNVKHNMAATVRIEDNTEPLDIRLGLALTVTGQVTDVSGAPIQVAKMQLDAKVSNWIVYIGEEVFTDAEGRYEIRAVPPEQGTFAYWLKAEAWGYGPSEWKKDLSKDVSQKRLKLEPFVLPRANLSVSGVVVDAHGKAAIHVPVFLSGLRGSRTAGQPSKQTVTNAEGEFSFNRICKGPLRIQAGYGGREKEPGYLDAEGGDKNLRIVLGQRGVHANHVSLVGKALPGFEGIDIEFDAAKVKGKKILVCFFDIGQRPSRHCVRELAKKAEQLKQKGVTAVAVQASKIDKGKLNKWVEENNISFAVGMIEDEEKTKLNWGVKSLPWLILTDKEHIVRAEGFGLEELDEKLKEINGE